jgi:Ca-activated chloride channel family protein
MTARMVTPALILVITVVAFALGGAAPFGRLTLNLGLPRLAVPLLPTPDWRGYALFRAGDYEAAAQSFIEAGAESSYNRGNAQAHAGEYAAAMEAYDIALAQNPDDAEALANFELIKSFYAGVELDPGAFLPTEEKDGDVTDEAETGQGQGRAQGTGSEATNFGTNPNIPLILSNEQQQVSRVFDAQFVEATDRWLATLEDEPGRYLAARIIEERKTRISAGTAVPEGEDPW